MIEKLGYDERTMYKFGSPPSKDNYLRVILAKKTGRSLEKSTTAFDNDNVLAS